jgi:hypothetical protein
MRTQMVGNPAFGIFDTDDEFVRRKEARHLVIDDAVTRHHEFLGHLYPSVASLRKTPMMGYYREHCPHGRGFNNDRYNQYCTDCHMLVVMVMVLELNHGRKSVVDEIKTI